MRKKKDENIGKYVLVEFSPKVCVLLFNVSFRKNWFKLIYIFSNQVVYFEYFFFLLATIYFATFIFEKIQKIGLIRVADAQSQLMSIRTSEPKVRLQTQ